MTAKIAAAFLAAQRAFGPALKGNTNPQFKSKYADLSACIEAVIDALNNAGISLIQRTSPDERGVTVETLFLHESGEMLQSGPLHVPASKQDPQGYGSALTYARRYSLMAACGIAPEDGDGNAAAKKKQTISPTDGALEKLSDEQRLRVEEVVARVRKGYANLGADAAADYIAEQNFDEREETAMWRLLQTESAMRAAIKVAQENKRASLA